MILCPDASYLTTTGHTRNGMFPPTLPLYCADAIFTITERMEVCNEDTSSTAMPSQQQGQGQGQGGNSSANSQSQSQAGGSGVISATRHDSFNSVNSDHFWADKSRVVTLRASSPEVWCWSDREGGGGEQMRYARYIYDDYMHVLHVCMMLYNMMLRCLFFLVLSGLVLFDVI